MIDAVCPVTSVAVTVNVLVPAADGVPWMVPVTLPSARPTGNAPARTDHAYGALPPITAKVWPNGAPVLAVASEGGDIDRLARVIVQVKPVAPAKSEGSVAMRVTGYVPAVVGTPVTVPVAASMDRPAGRPVAAQVKVALGPGPVALLACGVIALPSPSDRARGWPP